MSLIRAFYLRFVAPVRVGGGINATSRAAVDFPSDTLSAALVVAASELGGERVPNDELDSLARQPPWVVSSLLPWIGLGGRPVRFVPRPLHYDFNDDTRDSSIAYVSTDLLANWPTPYKVSRCGTLAATAHEAGHELGRMVWQHRVSHPSITVDRVTSAAAPFHLQTLSMGIGTDGGAWLAVQTETAGQMEFTRVLLSHLTDSGIGADRARGLGRFEIMQHLPFSMDGAEEPDRLRVLLGYALPDAWLEQAIQDVRARYRIVRRDGRVHGSVGALAAARKSLRLLAPGSVIPDRGLVVGRTCDITPDAFDLHAVIRDGRTLAWPLARRSS